MASNKDTKLTMVDPQPAEDLNVKAPEAKKSTSSAIRPAIDTGEDDDAAKPNSGTLHETDVGQPSLPSGDREKPSKSTQDPPLPPRRPKLERKESSFTLNLREFRSAFPNQDEDLCRALLVAASNNLEAAFQGMLALHDSSLRPNQYVREQIHSDEQLARELAIKDQRRLQHAQRLQSSRQRQREYSRDLEQDRYEAYRNDDTNSELYDDFQRGLLETKQAVSSFWGNIKSRISGELSDEPRDAFTEDEHVPGVPVNRRMNPNAPRLPPRTRSVDDNNHELSQKSALTPGKIRNLSINADSQQRTVSEGTRKTKEPPKEVLAMEPRSVNAFGDEQSAKSADQEPDAFFIGESDDDDLGSLDEDLDEDLPSKKPASEMIKKLPEAVTKETKETPDTTLPANTVEAAKDPLTNTKKDELSAEEKKDSEARSLLSKVKSQAETK